MIPSGQIPATPRQRRDDIQALRALAILLVLGHHVGLPFLHGGFLGVDLFFVLSGFLMVGLITGELERGTFRFTTFYGRRIRRLLPASLSTLAATALVAPWILDSVELAAFKAQLAGSLTFVANIVLWRQTDYFSTAADLKPLLHMWSLAIEEQFYLGLPLMLVLCPAKWRGPLLAAIAAVSLALCLALRPIAPTATFYLLPTRAWELALGGVVALAAARAWLPDPGRAVRLAAVFGLLVLGVVGDPSVHPGLHAVLACLATCILVMPGCTWRAHTIPARLLVAIGDRSYSLYLVHWPVLAFLANVMIGPVPLAWRLASLVPIFVLCEVQYRLIEQPTRRRQMTARFLAALGAVAGATMVFIVAMAHGAPGAQAADRLPNPGLAAQCDTGRGPFVAKAECQTARSPQTLVWGDSMAMHLLPGLAATLPGGVVQATKPACGPFLDIAPTDGGSKGDLWAQDCMAFNASVLAYLDQAPSIRTVVLSSILIPYLQQEDGRAWSVASGAGASWTVSPQDPEILAQSLARTVAALRASGLKVVLVAPPPNADIDYGRCNLRRTQGLPAWPASDACTIARADYLEKRAPVLHFLDQVERRAIVPVLRFEAALCTKTACRTRAGATSLYADHVHLSRRGSILLAREMGWAMAIADLAE